MEFYRDISYYYDYIFPFKQETFDFLQDCLNLSNQEKKESKSILDVACGSGSYALNFSLHGHNVIGTDLDSLMIQQAIQKSKNNNVKFKVHNMLQILELRDDKNNGFDLIYCIGNSIVHLDSVHEIKSIVEQAYDLLIKGACFVIQIINFDRILKDNVTKLPTIYNNEEGVAFKRNYIYLENEHKIEFSTMLNIETENINEQFVQSVKLYPLQVDEIYSLFEQVGFTSIELFGSFSKEQFNKDTSYPLIIRGVKA